MVMADPNNNRAKVFNPTTCHHVFKLAVHEEAEAQRSGKKLDSAVENTLKLEQLARASPAENREDALTRGPVAYNFDKARFS